MWPFQSLSEPIARGCRYVSRLQWLLSSVKMPDNLGTHVAAAATAGLMATIIGNPVDVVKTRVMAARKAAEASPAASTAAVSSSAAPSTGSPAAAPQYRNAFDCVVKTMRHEGPAAFYQGVVPQFFRITGWNIVMFVSFEQLKRAASMRLQ
jgi:hypothetical protein